MSRRVSPRFAAAVAAAVTSLAVVFAALAQSASGFDVSWRAPFGGSSSSGGTFAVRGVAGQPVAGASSGGAYQVSSGFLAGGAVKYLRLLPLLSKDGSQ
jgi:hypothetical protein